MKILDAEVRRRFTYRKAQWKRRAASAMNKSLLMMRLEAVGAEVKPFKLFEIARTVAELGAAGERLHKEAAVIFASKPRVCNDIEYICGQLAGMNKLVFEAIEKMHFPTGEFAHYYVDIEPTGMVEEADSYGI